MVLVIEAEGYRCGLSRQELGITFVGGEFHCGGRIVVMKFHPLFLEVSLHERHVIEGESTISTLA